MDNVIRRGRFSPFQEEGGVKIEEEP